MSDITNQVLLLCKLTREAELRYSKEGKAYATATVHYWHGKQADKTSFFDCMFFGNTAESVAQLPAKTKIALKGSLQQDTWQNAEGEKRSRIKIMVSAFQVRELPEGSAAPPAEEVDPFEGM